MAISPDEVRWIAHLARLELTEEEVGVLGRDLSAIVEYVNQLQQVNTDGIEPLAHPIEMSNVFREDEITPSLPVDEALANAPSRKGDYYAVPAVFE
jgi:aspartyl-tRNA(Asn)/glutamyl-tRNA(Gln) amidotransferase subunit C